MYYKLLVVDIDGTLVDGRGNISEKDRKALATAASLRVQVSLSTGRALTGCVSIIKRLGLNSHQITYDGALVSSPDGKEVVYSRPIGPDLVKQMIDFAHLKHIGLDLYSPVSYFAEGETWSAKAHRDFFEIEPSIVDFAGLKKEGIIKGGMALTDPDERARANEFCRHFSDLLHFSHVRVPAFPDVTFVNITAPEVSKGKALEALALHLDLSLAEVMAVGDGNNDIPLLSTAGLGVAMGNAPPDVKAVADYITLDIDHSGLAAAIERFLLS